jgi:Flp pilus assembly pilin Flp
MENNDREKGQGLAEYALVIGLVAIVAMMAMLFLGDQVSAIISSVARAL